MRPRRSIVVVDTLIGAVAGCITAAGPLLDMPWLSVLGIITYVSYGLFFIWWDERDYWAK